MLLKLFSTASRYTNFNKRTKRAIRRRITSVENNLSTAEQNRQQPGRNLYRQASLLADPLVRATALAALSADATLAPKLKFVGETSDRLSASCRAEKTRNEGCQCFAREATRHEAKPLSSFKLVCC